MILGNDVISIKIQLPATLHAASIGKVGCESTRITGINIYNFS